VVLFVNWPVSVPLYVATTYVPAVSAASARCSGKRSDQSSSSLGHQQIVHAAADSGCRAQFDVHFAAGARVRLFTVSVPGTFIGLMPIRNLAAVGCWWRRW